MRIVVDAYTDCKDGQRSPTLFQVSPNGECLLLLVDASETAFAHSYQPLIDVVKNSFSHALSLTAGSLRERLSEVTLAVEKTMAVRFPSSKEFGSESYSTVFVALGIVGNLPGGLLYLRGMGLGPQARSS